MKRKITILDALAIGGAVVRSIGRIRAEIEAAKDPHTPGGSLYVHAKTDAGTASAVYRITWEAR